ncbi:MAG: NAD-dependent DNA ligase LigA [Pseudobacteriovorax sp.]|nr:NAD-dependent DNA ligase LigA [Pseudobacteriovorax sp.]
MLNENGKPNALATLVRDLITYREAYYQGRPIVSDQKYDKLETELRKIDPNHPFLGEVGSESSSGANKVAHQAPMLSLQKTYKPEELSSWRDNRPIVGTWKIDGNSLSIVYENGVLKLAKTRGNGRLGEDVTDKIRWVADIPNTLSKPWNMEIRGELFCSESRFSDLVTEMLSRGLERPSNPRNIVAGVLGRKNHQNLALYFNFLGFEILSDDMEFDRETEMFAFLESLGISLPGPKLLKSDKSVEAFLNEVQQQLSDSEIGMDGAVFSFEERMLHQEMGQTSHHPRYKMSFKWQGATAESKISHITWATSRRGVVTPVAVIEPVVLSGAEITNVTLHNAQHVVTYNLKAGDHIEIVRSGEVIPKFLRVVKPKEGQYSWPKTCPSCGTELEYDGVRLKCMNVDSCPAQQIGTILNWIKSVEIEDLSEKRLQSLIDLGLVENPIDIYRLTKEDLLTLPLTKEKMAKKLYANIQKSKHLPLSRFLLGIGIEGMGLTSWEKLLTIHPSLNAIQELTTDELVAVDGFAEKTASQVVSGLEEKSWLIEGMLDNGVTPVVTQMKRKNESEITGKTFVITGTLSKSRNEIAKSIKEAGGLVASSVSKNTFALVTNDSESSSSKFVKAKSLGIPIWDESQLSKKLGE